MSNNKTQSQSAVKKYSMRSPNGTDASSIWRLVESSNTLDHNSFYCYFVLSQFFSSSCAVAEYENNIVGFVTGFPIPERPKTFFVWQIRVAEKMRGLGVAQSLVRFAIKGQKNIQFIETTISPNNKASQSLFSSLAKYYETQIEEFDKFMPISIFPSEAGNHEQENLFRVGPISL